MTSFLAFADGVQIPIGWIAAAGGAMAGAILVLWRWGVNRSKKVDKLQNELLAEKEEKFRILQGLKEKGEAAAEEGKRGKS